MQSSAIDLAPTPGDARKVITSKSARTWAQKKSGNAFPHGSHASEKRRLHAAVIGDSCREKLVVYLEFLRFLKIAIKDKKLSTLKSQEKSIKALSFFDACSLQEKASP